MFLCLACWVLAVGAGLRLVSNYENTPGEVGISPANWPAESRIPRAEGLPTLVMMVHPQCPCSRASLGELALLMAQAKGRVHADVVFVRPEGFLEECEKTDLWSSAAMIPGVTPRIDEEGVEARRFGSRTSGQIMLYGADGRLLFSGGITSARGHAGDNEGRSAIVSLLTEGFAAKRETPVFGCPIFGLASNDKSKDSCDAHHTN